MNAASATTTAISHGLTLGFHESPDAADAEGAAGGREGVFGGGLSDPWGNSGMSARAS